LSPGRLPADAKDAAAKPSAEAAVPRRGEPSMCADLAIAALFQQVLTYD
jgi:hypothetical protein